MDEGFILLCRCGVIIVFRRREKSGSAEEQLTLGVTQVNQEGTDAQPKKEEEKPGTQVS